MPGSTWDGVTSSAKGWSYLTGLFTSWAIYLCTGQVQILFRIDLIFIFLIFLAYRIMFLFIRIDLNLMKFIFFFFYFNGSLSSLEIVKNRSREEFVLSFVIVSSEMLAPWSLLFQYFGTNNLLFVTTIFDLVPYMVWMGHMIFKSKHNVELKWYCTVALIFELKVSAFLSLTFGESGILYIRTCGGCFASLAPLLYMFCKDWHPSSIHALSQFLRIIASSSELLLDNSWKDMFSKMETVKVCRMLTIVLAFLNLCFAIRICDLWKRLFKKVQSQKLSPLGTYTSNELYRRLAMTFASVPVGTEALV